MIVRPLRGASCHAVLTDVARLRIEVFAEWPYLYDGDLDYEVAYLRPYAESARSIVVGAFDGGQLVGAATGAPLIDHADNFGAAFKEQDLDVTQVFYCAESVLLPAHRGRGIGHRFFDLREAHARDLGFTYSAFCGVIRPDDHPARPANYRSLDAFWHGRGYTPLSGVVAQFRWKDLGHADETEKPLQFWMKTL